MAKTQRQHRISRLLESGMVSSQAHLVDLLAAEGVVATQATVSRDLDEIGAVKIRVAGGETVYAIPELPKDRMVPEEQVRRVLSEWVVEISHSLNLVVLRTPPGSAHVVASAIDRAAITGVLGTVAGDDTLLIVAAEKIGGDKVAKRLQALCGLQ